MLRLGLAERILENIELLESKQKRKISESSPPGKIQKVSNAENVHSGKDILDDFFDMEDFDFNLYL